MKQPIISVSGLRGIIGESLSPENAMRYSLAFGSTLGSGPVLVTRDGRSSGEMLFRAIAAGLMATGREVLYGDVASTPTAGVLVKQLQAAGGVQISASHNPPEYNGIKLFGPDGRVIGADAGQKVIDQLQADPHWVAWSSVGACQDLTDTTEHHLNLVLDTVDAGLIQSQNFKVVLDSNHGAGSVLGRRLLESLHTDFQILGGTPDGQFEHPPEPTVDNLRSVADEASRFGAHVVFCQDPDADRLAIIDETGRYVGEEYTLALTLKRRLMQQQGDVVINCATSRMSIDIAQSFGCECHLSAVGEANVCDMMLDVNAVYGGEGNGGPIDPRVGYVRDSFVAMTQVLELMAITGQPVSALVDEIPAYSIHKTKSTVDREKLPAIYDELKSEFPNAETNEMDGLRFDWDDRWLLIRPSNTEPIVRVICETANEGASRELADRTTRVIERLA